MSIIKKSAGLLFHTGSDIMKRIKFSYRMMMTKTRSFKSNSKDDEWIRRNFGKLVSKYPGQYVAVANEELFIGPTRGTAEKAAEKKYPEILPSVMQVPRSESLTCAL